MRNTSSRWGQTSSSTAGAMRTSERWWTTPWLKMNVSHSRSARAPERPKRRAKSSVASVRAIVAVCNSPMEASIHTEVATAAASAPSAANGPAAPNSIASTTSRATVASPQTSE